MKQRKKKQKQQEVPKVSFAVSQREILQERLKDFEERRGDNDFLQLLAASIESLTTEQDLQFLLLIMKKINAPEAMQRKAQNRLVFLVASGLTGERQFPALAKMLAEDAFCPSPAPPPKENPALPERAFLSLRKGGFWLSVSPPSGAKAIPLCKEEIKQFLSIR